MGFLIKIVLVCFLGILAFSSFSGIPLKTLVPDTSAIHIDVPFIGDEDNPVDSAKKKKRQLVRECKRKAKLTPGIIENSLNQKCQVLQE